MQNTWLRIINENIKIYNKEPLIYALTNVLGTLIIKYNVAQFNRDYKSKSSSPLLYLSMNNNLYMKEKNKASDSIVRKNISNFQLTRTNRDQIIEILVKNGIANFYKGKRGGPDGGGKLGLNELTQWNPSLFKISIEENLKLYHCIEGDYLLPLVISGLSEKVEPPPAYVKHKNGITPAIDENIALVEKLNRLFPESIRKDFSYRRIFNEDELTGGRLYGEFTSMPKKYRKLLIVEPFSYSEVDFQSFVPKAMSAYNKGEIDTERAYNKVSRALIKAKLAGKGRSSLDINHIDEYTSLIANVIKEPTLSLLNNVYTSRGTINTLKNNRYIWQTLESSGLANTVAELQQVSKFYSKDSANAYALRQSSLYEMRKKRWEENINTMFPCPRFLVKPRNILDAIEKALPEVQGFLFTESWKWTQFIESEILLSFVDNLEQDNLLPLFVHDSLYVPADLEFTYRQRANEYLLDVLGQYKESVYPDELYFSMKEQFRDYIKGKIDQNTLSSLTARYHEGKPYLGIIRNLYSKLKKANKKLLLDFVSLDENNMIFGRLLKEYGDSHYKLVKAFIIEILVSY